MNILIVESCAELGEIWKRHLERLGMDVVLRHGQQEAIQPLSIGKRRPSSRGSPQAMPRQAGDPPLS